MLWFAVAVHGLRLSARARTPVACSSRFSEDLNLIYDGKCAICQWEKDNLLGLGAKNKIMFTDLEDGYDEEDARNGGVSYADGMARITAITSDGQVLVGMRVFAECYERVGLGWLFAPLSWPVVGPLVEWAYELFAAVRTDVTRGRSMRELVAERQALMSATIGDSQLFDWRGFERSAIDGLARPLLVAKGAKGFAACGYIDVATCDKLQEACIIFTGVDTCDDFLTSKVVRASMAAEALGCEVGMLGSDALDRLR